MNIDENVFVHVLKKTKKIFTSIHWTLWLTIGLLAFLIIIFYYPFNIDYSSFTMRSLKLSLHFFQAAVIFSIIAVISLSRDIRRTFIWFATLFSLMVFVVLTIINITTNIMSEGEYLTKLKFHIEIWLSIQSLITMVFLTLIWFFRTLKTKFKCFIIAFFIIEDVIMFLHLTGIIEISFNYWMIAFFIVMDISVFIIFNFFSNKFRIIYPKNIFGIYISLTIVYNISTYLYLKFNLAIMDFFGHIFVVIAHVAALFSIFRTFIDYPYDKIEFKLEERTKSIQVVSSIISHDSANLLSKAVGYLDLGIDLKSLDYAEKSIQPILQAQQLITKLLETTKNILKSEREIIDLHQEISNVINDIKKKNTAQEMLLDIQCSVFDYKILGYKIITNVFQNLIENSIRYSPRKNVSIKISANIKNQGKEGIELVFEDNGKGISESMKKKILKKPVSSEKGYGMGLFMSNYIIKEYFNGTVKIEDRVEGETEKGTKVTVFLPKSKKDAKQLERAL